jgi:hypothetical protein
LWPREGRSPPSELVRPGTRYSLRHVALVHFWVRGAGVADELDSWDPDAEPWRFASGIGHNVLELFVRLRQLGLPVSLGPVPSEGVGAVVVFLKSALVGPRHLGNAMAAAWRGKGRVVVIRSDAVADATFPIRPLIEFVGSPTQVVRDWQRWLPALPQRGLIRRSEDRMGRIRRVAFKGNPENVPPELLTQQWVDALSARGVEWWLDAPSATDGSNQAWHDFSDVDAVLCLRREGIRDAIGGGKPPTRLINAWAAGSIPIVAREPSYSALAREGVDAFFVDSVWGTLDVIDRLNGDPGAVLNVEQAIARRAQEYQQDEVVRLWGEALLDAARTREAASRRALRVGATALWLGRAKISVKLGRHLHGGPEG